MLSKKLKKQTNHDYYKGAHIPKLLYKRQCEFRKGFDAQNSLLKLLQNWRQSLDQGLVFGVLLTYLSKAFDCFSHELLTAKLSAYGVDISAVRFIYDYLTNRKQIKLKIIIGHGEISF